MSISPGRSSFSRNAASLLFDGAASFHDRPAIVDGEKSTDFAALADRSRSIASALARRGVQRGDRVVVRLERGADAAAAFFGVLAVGGIAINANEGLRPRQIEYILEHSSAAALVTSAELAARLARPLSVAVETVDLDQLPSHGEFEPLPTVGGDVAQIIYTSGSTGLPKGVTVSHANLWAGTSAVVEYLGISSRDRLSSVLPLSFDYGLNQLLCCVATGATLVVERSPVPHRVARSLREHEVTVLAAVPPLWLQLLRVDSFKGERIESLRAMTNTGGRLPSDAVRKLRSCQPQAELFLMYGLTEAFRSTYLPPDRVDVKPTSIGQAIPGAEVLVLDERLMPCKPRQVGQLIHRGPTVALGYWDDPEATAQIFKPNPLRPTGVPDTERVVFSGDLVYVDEQGDLFFVGREDSMIKTLGYRVSPDEVAELMYSSGEVLEAVVSSEPDDLRGARIVAHIVLAPDGKLERLWEFVTREMPRYMQPGRIEVVSALDRTASGKHDVAASARPTDNPD